MPAGATESSIGERIAVARKVAGLNQYALAQRASYSTSMVRAVEQGREPASPSFVACVARALGVEIEELYGQPYRDLLDDDGGLPGVEELRTLFAEGRHVTALQPSSLDELAADLECVRTLRHSDRARRAIAMTPVLLRQLHGAVRDAVSDADRARAHRALAQCYANTGQLVFRFGWLPLATQALDRAEAAAEHSDDPLLLAHALQQRALLLLSHAAYDTATALVDQSLHRLPSDDREATLALRGAAHLRGAITAARNCDTDRAHDHIDTARDLGARIGRQSTAYDTNFGPGNVEIHHTAVALESGDPDRAARTGSQLRLPADVPATRSGHHWQDVARAWVLTGDHGQALHALNNARRIAPQQTRYHPQVHETARAIAQTERRKSDSVAHFAHWLGLKL